MVKLTKKEKRAAQESADKLREIQAQISDLMSEAREIVQVGASARRKICERANAYWLPTVEDMVGDPSKYDYTMGETIKELESLANGEDSEDSDE